jgi:uncharacterized protein
MVVEIKRQVVDGNMLKWLAAAGLAWLEHNQEKVNRMNVFPVPDGDTGTNMRLTMKKAYDMVAEMDEQHVGIVSDALAKGALMGARGNSGVILSQLWQGFAQALRGREVFDAQEFAYALQKASDVAYKAVIEPVEGTILTVAREAAKAACEYADDSEPELREMLNVTLDAAHRALQRTPEQLPVLKKAGVMDSGGQGFVFLLEGMARMLNGEPVNLSNGRKPSENTRGWEDALEPEDEDGYGYDVQFLIRGEHLNVAKIRADIDAMGWSTLVVGDEALVKVHVHVHDPGQPLSYAIGLGAAIDDIVVENMQRQYESYVAERLAEEEPEEIVAEEGIAVIAVVSGDGMEYLFKHDLGAAATISGGQTMNPSTEDFLNVINRLQNEEIILLPNNKNIIMAAEQAASLARGKRVKVVPTRTIPQGINALITYGTLREEGAFDEIHREMVDAASTIKTLEVTNATRQVELDDVVVEEGQPIGLIEGKLVVADSDLNATVQALLKKADAGRYELITLYYGKDVQGREAEALAEALNNRYDGLEIHTVYGGQPLYPYIISLE